MVKGKAFRSPDVRVFGPDRPVREDDEWDDHRVEQAAAHGRYEYLVIDNQSPDYHG